MLLLGALEVYMMLEFEGKVACTISPKMSKFLLVQCEISMEQKSGLF